MFPTEAGHGSRWRVGFVWAKVWGVALGAAMSCKLTGWLAPLPFIADAMVYGDRKTASTIGIGLLTALAMFWFTNPRLWHHPVDGMATFFQLNLHRGGTAWLNIPTLFFGSRYDMQAPLPWYNTLVWTAITVPLGTFVLALVSGASALRRWAAEPEGMLIFGNWLVLVVVRALPGTPVHDAERLILPSFAFLAALAGVGAARVLELAPFIVLGRPGPCVRTVNGPGESHDDPSRGEIASAGHSRNATEGVPYRSRLPRYAAWMHIRARGPGLPGWAQGPGLPVGRAVAVTFVAIAYLSAVGSVVWYAPQWLSYYSPIIGGFRGADAAGMEATYYWDALDDEVLD